MASDIISSVNKIINQTTTQIIDSELPKKVSSVITTLVTSSFSAVDDILKKIQDLTKDKP
ncbi:MAG: hypothetical protein PHC61_02610 [Chitinivibrionales bacterium]|nr:hypothetical protein [Chitinivibrionales bacterium]